MPTDSCAAPWPPAPMGRAAASPPCKGPHGSPEGDDVRRGSGCSRGAVCPHPAPTWDLAPRCCGRSQLNVHSWQPVNSPLDRSRIPLALLQRACAGLLGKPIPPRLPPCIILHYRPGKAARSLLGVTGPRDAPRRGRAVQGTPVLLSLGSEEGHHTQRPMGAGSCLRSRGFAKASIPFIQSKLLHRESHP